MFIMADVVVVATLPFSSRTVAYWLLASGHDDLLQRPVKLNSFRQNFWVFVLRKPSIRTTNITQTKQQIMQ